MSKRLYLPSLLLRAEKTPLPICKPLYVIMIKTRNTFLLLFLGLLFMSLCVNEIKHELAMNELADTFIELPDSKDVLVVRTYFDNDKDWNKLSKKLTDSYEMGFTAHIELFNDERFENASVQDIIEKSKPNYKHSFIFVADSLTFANPENSVLCIDLYDYIGKSFRVIPSELWGVENNLSIANMDFYEFHDGCDSDGVFRGFK